MRLIFLQRVQVPSPVRKRGRVEPSARAGGRGYLALSDSAFRPDS